LETTTPRIIGLLQQKGGVGKTTLSLNIAGYFASQGERVLLVDADPQGSSLAWSDERCDAPPFSLIGKAVPSIHKDLPDIAADYDRVIIDGAPGVNGLFRSCILASDLVLIPVQPSPFDIWACVDAAIQIEEAQQFHKTIKAAFVVSRKITNTVIGKKVFKAFSEHAFPVLDAAVHQRVIYAESAAVGKTVFDVEDARDAQLEIARLCRELNNQKERIAA
jgi:chromosome partitioning protein